VSNITSVLNIAKEALLTHQASIAVTSHNVANVDTPGYSRQALSLTPNVATPHRVGYFGNGVTGQSIVRKYDQFMVQRLMTQNSTIEDLEAQQQSIRILEATFNEAPGLAVNDLLSQFWASIQELANNPELTASRQTVVQQGSLLAEQFHTMAAEIAQTKFDIDLNLSSTIDDINSLTSQISEINVVISSNETEQVKQNDLRDTRDGLLKELAGYIDLRFFEAENGSYTVLMSDGNVLVEGNQRATLDWTNNELFWQSTNYDGRVSQKQIGGDPSTIGGKIGGLITINADLIEGNPDNYLGRLDALANSIIRELNSI